MVMWAAMSLAGSWPRAPQLFPTPSWFMPNLGRGRGCAGAQGPLLPRPPLLCPASRVPDLVGNGEGGGQADVLVDAAASLPLTHAAHGGQAWGTGTAVGLVARAVLAALSPCQSHPRVRDTLLDAWDPRGSVPSVPQGLFL